MATVTVDMRWRLVDCDGAEVLCGRGLRSQIK